MTKPKYHMVSFSGGKDSTAMLLHMMELGMQIDEVLYCDRADYSVEKLTARFELEEQLEVEGKSINPHNKEFRKSWNKVLSKLRKEDR